MTTQTFDFWLLDINHDRFKGEQAIMLWGIDGSGRRILLIDKAFKPRFYLLPSDEKNTENKIEEIQVALSKHDLKANLFKETRKIFGHESQLIRVEYEDPDKLDRILTQIRKMGGIEKTYESDIRPSASYLIQTNAAPSSWHKVKGKKLPAVKSITVDSIFELISPMEAVDVPRLPNFRIMAFDVLYLSETGSPDPKKEPIRAISIKTNKTVMTIEAKGRDDSSAIRKFIKIINEEDPDILVGFGCNKRDWPYLLARAQADGIDLKVSRMDSEPHQSAYGHFSVTGRGNVDLEDFAEDIPSLEFKTVGALAEDMEIRVPQGFEDLEPYEVNELWTSLEGRKEALDLSSKKTSLLSKLLDGLLEFLTQLSSLTRLPLDQIMAAAVGFRVDSYLASKAREYGEVIPERQERPYIPYAGGIVLEPERGLHEWVDVVDFRSMYPNVITSFNLSPETFLGKGVRVSKADMNMVPELGYAFAKKPQGFFPRALLALLEERARIKEELKKATGSKQRILLAREKVVKVISNAMYGYSGWLGSRWYSHEMAESTTSYGRHLISRSIGIAKEEGLRVIYGDTDSIFVSHDEKKVRELLEKIEDELGFEARLDKTYKRLIFTEAKKRYTGITIDGKIDIVGLEAIRSDWSQIARTAQREVIASILNGDSESVVRGKLNEIVAEVKEGKHPMKDFVIWKTMSKPLEEYKVRAPHVEAARALVAEGWTIKPGDKIGYIITRGPAAKKRLVKPYPYVLQNEVNYEYYIEEQVVPASVRVIESAFPVESNQMKRISPEVKTKPETEVKTAGLGEVTTEFSNRMKTMKAGRALIVHHVDADGLCGAAILKRTLESMGWELEMVCLEKLFPEVLSKIHADEHSLIVYVDLGSPHVKKISQANTRRKMVLVIDHHDPQRTEDPLIMNYNPELYGVSGESDASSSVMCYLIAKAFDASNRILAPIAMIGSMELPGYPTGLNGEVLDEGLALGLIEVSKSGKGKSISVRSGESWINRQKASTLLTALGSVGYYRGGPSIAISAILNGISKDVIEMAERMGSERKAAFDVLQSSIRRTGLKKRKKVQWVEAGSALRGMGSKVIGTFLSMLRYSRLIDPDKYLLGFMDLEPQIPWLGSLKGNWIKVSGRVPPRLEALIKAGTKPSLSEIMMAAADQVGGFADGHAYAASGVIPSGTESKFIELLETTIV